MTKVAGPVARVGRWVLFVVAACVVLRPALTISISYDDLINPLRLRYELGANPVHIVVQTIRDLSANGHFNYVGQSIGALIYVGWERLMAAGVRYTTIYALTKLVVFVAAVTVSAKLLRTLLALVGRTWSPWRARTVLGVLLAATVQLHVPWSFDPVGGFPLWGYLSVVVGFGALIVAVPILVGDSTRTPWWGALAFCLAILYYEINVAMVVALVPIGVLGLRRLSEPADRRALIRRVVTLMGPPTVMTVILMLWARHANQGYEGTQTGLGSGGLGNLVHTVGSSLPAVSWTMARDWLGVPVQLTVWASVGAVIVGAAMLALAARPRQQEPRVLPAEALLLAVSMLVVWLVTSAVQGATPKVNEQSSGFGQVYMYYAFGSLALPMAGVLALQAWRGAPWWRWGRNLALSAAIVFAFVQLTINDNAQRRFDERYPGIDQLLNAYADNPPEDVRCAALFAFRATPWAHLFPAMPVIVGLLHASRYGSPFCSTPGAEDPM